MVIAPIALFCFNRLDHLKRTVNGLKANDLAKDSELYIFSDGPRSDLDIPNVKAVREYLETIDGFKAVHLRLQEKNRGLALSIISGVSQIVENYGRVIVVEDDLVTSPYFLRFMNEGLELYKEDENVASIHGYTYPVRGSLPETFFIRGADCWGWATWARAWAHMEQDGSKLLRELKEKSLETAFNMNGAQYSILMLQHQIEGKNNSWAIRWHASCFLKGMLTLYPSQSLVSNIGFDGTGTHCGDETTGYETSVARRPVKVERVPAIQNEKARKLIEAYFWRTHHGQIGKKLGFIPLLLKIKNRIKEIKSLQR